MSEVKRFIDVNNSMEEYSQGPWVKFEAYDALQQKLDAVLAENARMLQDYRDIPEIRRIGAPLTPATDVMLNTVRADAIDEFGRYHNFSGKLLIQQEAKKYAAKLRAETDTTPSQYESLAGGK